ncbi:MAG: hypothetical protein VX738_10185 [Planctomycetota bacterium]|nr:hypothetical protein [Planctomycetota bacterium]
MPIQLENKHTVGTDGQLFNGRFTPCGNYLVAGGFDGQLHRWKLSDGEPAELPPISGHQGWAQAFAFHPSETRVYSTDSWVNIACMYYTLEKPQAQWTHHLGHDGWIRGIQLTTAGDTFVTCGRDQAVRRFKSKNGKLLNEYLGHQADVYCLAIHPTSQTLVSADAVGTIIVWDTKKQVPHRKFDASELFMKHRLQDVGGVKTMTFSPDGKTLLAAGTRPSGGGNVQGIPLILGFDWASGEKLFSRELGGKAEVYVQDMRFHPEGYLIAVTSGNPGTGQLLFIDLDQAEPTYKNNTLANCHAVSVHPNGRTLAVTATSKGSNGNGRRLDKDGNYLGNSSPIYLFQPADPTSTDPAP